MSESTKQVLQLAATAAIGAVVAFYVARAMGWR